VVDQIETLRRLQAIDAQLFRLRIEQQQQPLALERTKQVLAEEQAKAQALEARLKTLQIQQKEKEIELATREATVKKLQLQLFQVKTNKEYAAIQREIDQSKADASLLEEEILKLMDAIDQAAREHKTQLAQVTAQQARVREDEARVAQALKTIEEGMAALEGQRQAVTPSVQAVTLSVYERVLASREGLALVPLVNESCGGCHMVQPPQVVNEVSLKAKLVTCENCNRILYADEFR
jgi:predicted  nucleic acid-binding Zn-ribbon protein